MKFATVNVILSAIEDEFNQGNLCLDEFICDEMDGNEETLYLLEEMDDSEKFSVIGKLLQGRSEEYRYSLACYYGCEVEYLQVENESLKHELEETHEQLDWLEQQVKYFEDENQILANSLGSETEARKWYEDENRRLTSALDSEIQERNKYEEMASVQHRKYRDAEMQWFDTEMKRLSVIEMLNNEVKKTKNLEHEVEVLRKELRKLGYEVK